MSLEAAAGDGQRRGDRKAKCNFPCLISWSLLGTMSEAELHLLRSRLLGGKLKKASQGQLRFRLPTGLIYDPEGRIVFDPSD